VRDLPTIASEMSGAYKVEKWATSASNNQDFETLYVMRKDKEMSRSSKDALKGGGVCAARSEDQGGESIS